MAKSEKKVGFIKSVINEMKIVTWPSKKQLKKDTITVIETSILFGLMFAAMDWIVSKVFGFVIKG